MQVSKQEFWIDKEYKFTAEHNLSEVSDMRYKIILSSKGNKITVSLDDLKSIVKTARKNLKKSGSTS